MNSSFLVFEFFAIVDLHVERGIEIGAAASSRLLGRFMERDANPESRQLYGRRETRETGADDVHDSGTHRARQRTRIQIRRPRRSFTAARGAFQPRATNCDRIE